MTKKEKTNNSVQAFDAREALIRFKNSFTPDELDHAINELNIEWLDLDTWTPRQGLLLMVGIDPYRSESLVFKETSIESMPNPTWARITERPYASIDENGIPVARGFYLDLDQLLILSRIFQRWLSNPGHDLETRHSPHYFCEWAKRKAFDTFLELQGLKWANTAPAEAKPVQRSKVQDSAILEALRELGHDPQKLPKNKPGKPGVKAAVFAQLVGKSRVFPSGGTQFTHAWERLRSNGDLADQS